MIKRLVALTILASLVSTPALAINGRDLYEYSRNYQGTSNPTFSSGYFVGYVTAVVDAMRNTLCIPDGATYGDAADKVKVYLKEHPELSGYDAHLAVYATLQELYPCPLKK